MQVTHASQPVVARTAVAPATQPAGEATSARLVEKRPALLGHSPLDSFSKLPASAKDVRTTQSQQLHQVADGVRDGSISGKESEKLLTEQKSIAEATQDALSDGKLSLRERIKLGAMQTLAADNIHEAGGKVPDLVLPRAPSPNAERQAGQIDRLADGRSNGSITDNEASKLLGQQAEISEARSGLSVSGTLSVGKKLDAADDDLTRHSRPGEQRDLKSLFDLPRPGPMQRPDSTVLPKLPRDSNPVIERRPPGAYTDQNDPKLFELRTQAFQNLAEKKIGETGNEA